MRKIKTHTLICLFLLIQIGGFAQKLKELDAEAYRKISQSGVTFINFNVPTCDMAEYYNQDIEMLNRQLPDIPIYFFDKKKYPEIDKEFKLWEANKLAMVHNGKFVSHYEGIYGLNLMKNWIVTEWNKDKGTNYPISNNRFLPNSNTIFSNYESHKVLDFPFDSNGVDKVGGTEKFRQGAENSTYEGNCLRSEGVYKSSKVNYFTSWTKEISTQEFTLALEFMPFVTTYNTILVGSPYSRFFGIELQQDMLVFFFENGNYRYICNETKLKAEEWNSLVVSYDNKAKELQVVLNSETLKGFRVSENIDIKDGNASFGICNFGSGSVYKGYLNNFRVYNKSFKNGDLIRLAQLQPKEFPNMSKYIGSALVGDFSFKNKINLVNGKEDFVLNSKTASIQSGTLQLKSQVNDSYPRIQTKPIVGLDPRNFTLQLDFSPSSLGEHNFQYFVGLHARGTRYLNVRTKGTELEVQIEYKNGENSFITQGVNLQLNKWYKLVLSFNELEKTLVVSLDSKTVLNKRLDNSKAFSRLSGEAFVAFSGFGNPYTFSGRIDNLKIYRKALSAEEIEELSLSEEERF